jgi:hypothetical protein
VNFSSPIASAATDAVKTLVQMALDEAGYSHLGTKMCWEDGGFSLYHHEGGCECRSVHITNLELDEVDPKVMWRAYFLADQILQIGGRSCWDCYMTNFSGNGPVECSHPVLWC